MNWFPPQPRDFYVRADLDNGRGGIVYHTEVYMKDTIYDVAISNGKTGDEEFATGYTVWHRNLGAVAAPKIAAAADKVEKTVAKHADPQGELTATLRATIDGVTQPAIVHRLTYDRLGDVEVKLAQALLDLAVESSKHVKAKHGKKKGKPVDDGVPGDLEPPPPGSQ